MVCQIGTIAELLVKILHFWLEDYFELVPYAASPSLPGENLWLERQKVFAGLADKSGPWLVTAAVV